MYELPWVETARKYVGTAEVRGSGTSPVIRGWLTSLRAWWTDDETPWCGTFVAACMRENGIVVPKHWYRAMGWLDWGVPIARPVYGCVVVYSRTGGGHVGFGIGEDDAGRIMTIGGNQGNRVSIAPFDRARVAGYRVPVGYEDKMLGVFPKLASNGQQSSQQEA